MRSALLLVTLILAALSVSAQRGNPRIELDGYGVDAMIADFMERHGVSGMSVAIVQAPYITRNAGFGIADRERRTLVSTNTMFGIGAMKNAFTAVAVMQLVEAGKLQLDDRVEGRTIAEHIRRPGDGALLESIIAKASGRTYAEFVRQGQFEPLGLRHTFFASELDAVTRESLGAGEKHRRFLREPKLIDPTEPATGYRGTSALTPRDNVIYASAGDISIWDIGLAGDILIKDPALRKILYAPLKISEALTEPTTGPWNFPGHPGLMIATGSSDGFSSLLSRFTSPAELLCVTLLANKEGLDLTQLARNIAGAHNAKTGPPARARSMRVQQSPFSVAETMERLQRALTDRGVKFGVQDDASLLIGTFRANAWEENGAVWVAADDPSESTLRDTIDAALLRAVTATHE
jgi:D-alanyl-D-alanine carboxypeptidase